MTIGQDETIAEHMDRVSQPGGIHYIWHQFLDHMKKKFYTLVPGIKKDLTQSKRKYKETDFSKVKGYEAMCHVARFANKHPEVKIVGVDDNWHASSDLVLIPHESADEYWGTSVVYLSQCSPDTNCFFLYPEHLDMLIEELLKIQQKQKEKPDRITRLEMEYNENEDE